MVVNEDKDKASNYAVSLAGQFGAHLTGAILGQIPIPLTLISDLPRKLAKPEKPTRTGTLWALRNPAGDWLLEQRPERGLLGGMLGFPTTGWDSSSTEAPVTADWTHAGEVRHTFTHFHLVLTVLTATTTANPAQGTFQQVRPTDLPTVMRKAHAAASKANPSR